MGIVERIREIRADEAAREQADKLADQVKLQEERVKTLQADALKKLRRADREREIAQRCAELLPLLDSIAGAKVQLEEVRDQIWGGLGVIQDHCNITGSWNEEDVLHLGHRLTYEYKSALEEWHHNGQAPSEDKWGQRIPGTGRPITRSWHERIPLWCEVSISVGVDSANRVAVGWYINDEPRFQAMSFSEQSSLRDRKSNSLVGELYADDQVRSYAIVQDLLAKACMNTPPINELKQAADQRLRKLGFDESVRARTAIWGRTGYTYRE